MTHYHIAFLNHITVRLQNYKKRNGAPLSLHWNSIGFLSLTYIKPTQGTTTIWDSAHCHRVGVLNHPTTFAKTISKPYITFRRVPPPKKTLWMVQRNLWLSVHTGPLRCRIKVGPMCPYVFFPVGGATTSWRHFSDQCQLPWKTKNRKDAWTYLNIVFFCDINPQDFNGCSLALSPQKKNWGYSFDREIFKAC